MQWGIYVQAPGQPIFCNSKGDYIGKFHWNLRKAKRVGSKIINPSNFASQRLSAARMLFPVIPSMWRSRDRQ